MRGFSRRLTLVVLVTTFGLMGRASAVEWLLQGARQRAMGGAGVATADECSAVYWNPASLSGGTNWSFGLDTDLSVEFAPGTLRELEQVVNTVQELETGGIYEYLQTSLDNLNTAGTASDEDLAKVLGLVLNNFSHLDRKDLGGLVDGALNINVQAGSFGVSVGVGGFFDVGLVADLQGLAMASLGMGDAAANMASAMYVLGLDYSALTVDLDDAGIPAGISDLGHTIEAQLIAEGVPNATAMAGVLLYIAGETGAANPLDAQLSALGITNFADADLADPDVQKMLINMVAATLGDKTLVEENDTGIHLRGATIGQVAIAKSFSFFDKLRVGATAKIMTARTCNVEINYANYDPSNMEGGLEELTAELSRQLSGDPVETTQLGIDIGVDFDLTEVVRLGLVMKNLNRPRFDMPNTNEKFVMEPQVRMGVAVRPLPWLLLATDVDLTENRSQIATDYGTRCYSFGAELSAKVVQFRLGFYGNLLAPEANPAVTLGAGVKIGPAFKLDLALSLAGDPSKVMGMMGGGDLVVSDLPEGGGASLSVQFHTKF